MPTLASSVHSADPWANAQLARGNWVAIRETGVRRVSVGELLDEDLFIPSYQRPYSWEPWTALQLLDDIVTARRAGESRGGANAPSETSYVLGAVILHRDPDGHGLNVVDGQQRLLTLIMILGILDRGDSPDPEVDPRHGEDPNAPIVLARRRLAGRVRDMRSDPAQVAQVALLATFIRNRCELIRVETDDADEAFRVFDSQNYRGKALRPHDLLKAFHLREMRGESDAMKLALVETWELTPDADLDRLFSTYLWRIRQWSRGLSAPPFSSRHVDAFKGITRNAARTPSAQYHLAAQATVPLLASWNAQPEDEERIAARSRFQLDAPVQAGRFFFEMVTFMLAELQRLRGEGYAGIDRDDFASTDKYLRELPSRSHYRYVSELYLAALLYYTNKFGDVELPEAKRILMRWSYGLRTRLRRVQMSSVNNLARDPAPGQSAFVLLRSAERPAELRRLTTDVEERNQDPDHMKDLRRLLVELDA